jgi:hypothetical protein
MALQALMFTQDRTLVPTLSRLFGSVAINVNPCANAAIAVERLTSERFHAVVVDCEDRGNAARVLDGARAATLNSRAIRLGVVDREIPVGDAFGMGATLVVEKPITTPAAHLTARATQSLIMREQRRYFRCPVDLAVSITAPKAGAIEGQILNLSQDGMGIRIGAQLEPASSIRWRFVLPDLHCTIEGTGRVVWTGAEERAGIQLTDMSATAHEQLRSWLDKRFETVGLR